MNKAKSQEVVVKESGAIMALPTQRMGFDNFDVQELVLPRIKLLQATSKSVTGGNGKIGQFQNSLTSETLPDTLDLVLLGMKNGAIYFNSQKKLVCKSEDGIKSTSGEVCSECPIHKVSWMKFKKREPNAPKEFRCVGVKEFLAIKRDTLLSPDPFIILIPFMKSSFSLGKQLISMAYLYDPAIFARSYLISSEKIENSDGTFAKFIAKPSIKLNEEEFKSAARHFEILSKVKINNDDEPVIMEDI